MIKINEIKLVPIQQLKPNPQNRNTHPSEQIERLIKLIEHQGFRQPIVVSNQSGFIVTGHGRLIAAKKLKLTHVPVSFQDFDSDEQEYTAQVSDNAIASWSELDLSAIHKDLQNFNPFDIDLLGIKDFQFEPIMDIKPVEKNQEVECPNCKCKFKP